MTDRFKVGDTLVWVRSCESRSDFEGPGTLVKVLETDGDGMPRVEILGEVGGWNYINDIDYELTEIANSPLFKALE